MLTPDQNLDLLCDAIMNTKKFDMSLFYSYDWQRGCHTPCCIAGHAVFLWPDISISGDRRTLMPNYVLFAAKVGLRADDLIDLCNVTSGTFDGDLESITPRMAVAAICRLKETGKIYFDWNDEEND